MIFRPVHGSNTITLVLLRLILPMLSGAIQKMLYAQRGRGSVTAWHSVTGGAGRPPCTSHQYFYENLYSPRIQHKVARCGDRRYWTHSLEAPETFIAVCCCLFINVYLEICTCMTRTFRKIHLQCVNEAIFAICTLNDLCLTSRLVEYPLNSKLSVFGLQAV